MTSQRADHMRARGLKGSGMEADGDAPVDIRLGEKYPAVRR